MKNKLVSLLAVTAILALPACKTAPVNPPAVTPTTTGTSAAVPAVPAATPKPSFWQVMVSNITTFNKQVADVWNAPATQQAVKELQPVAKQAVATLLTTGGKISSAQAAALGFQSATALIPSVPSNAELQTTLTQVIGQFANDPNFKQPAKDLINGILASLPPNATPVQMAQATSAAGTALSYAATAASTPAQAAASN